MESDGCFAEFVGAAPDADADARSSDEIANCCWDRDLRIDSRRALVDRPNRTTCNPNPNQRKKL
jgi:hypothetical protein